MWGDAEGAYALAPTDKLSKSLLAVTGPTHVPYHHSKWQQLMLDYEQLVHLHNLRLVPHENNTHDGVEEEGDIVGKACRRCAQHSCTSSNLAALTLHVARMLRDLQVGIVELTNSYREKYQLFESGTEDVNNNQEGKSTTKLRIALIGKARATCGAVNILKLFSHETIVEACQQQGSGGSSYHDHQSASQGVNNVLREAFTYRSRDLNGLDAKIDGQDAAIDLISSIMSFLSTFGQLACHEGDADRESPKFFDPPSIPEIYDVIVQVLSLMLVLLSTQLYQPMISSAQLAEKVNTTSNHYFLERLMDYSYWQRQNSRQTRSGGEDDLNGTSTEVDNEPLLILQSCFHWLINRPKPPKRSISSHHVGLTKSIVQQLSDMAIAPDGMYESHSIVMSILPVGESTEKPSKLSVPPSASATQASNLGLIEKQSASSTTIALGTDDNVGITSPGHVSGTIATRTSSKLLLPLRSIIFLSSSLFLLPIRLVKLAFRVIGKGGQRVLLGNKNSLHGQDISTSDHATLQHLQSQIEKASGYNMTNNILWITESPIADLSSALILLLSNNCRANLESGNAKQRSLIAQNPFRIEMATLNDKRWDGQITANSSHENSLFPPDENTTTTSSPGTSTALSLDFESLFASFGCITHTEVGALLLYNMLQSSPIFAASLMARSDLDTLVMPILRTLYFSSKLSHETSHAQSRFLLEKDQPFRAQSQLYVILILLLIFSQDPSFGRDSFRRTTISKVTWYKERQMKEVSLGSMIIVVLLKAITFNLNRLQDEFLLSNCIAVLLNLSPHIVDIHPYVSSRLVSVTVSCFKRYAVLVDENNGQIECDGDMSSPLGMHGETCRTLLQLIKHSIRPKCIETNLQLLYSILLEEHTFQKICDYAPLKELDTSSIVALMNRASSIIQDNGGTSSAGETMKALKSSTEWKSYLDALPRKRANSFDSLSSDASDIGNLTFQYEEESDPEIFFVPYIWDVTVCTLTAFEWARNKIQVFHLNLNDNGIDDPGIDEVSTIYNHSAEVV